MEWTDVLEGLHHLDLTAVTHSGRLVVEGDVERVTSELVDGIREHRNTLLTILAGGHTWCPCTTCGLGMLLPVRTPQRKPRTAWPSCHLTPGCSGDHRPRQAQTDALIAAGVPAPATQAQPPARPAHRRLLGPVPCFPGVDDR